MKVLILSCTTGQGYNEAGQAIYEGLKKRKIDCDFEDGLSFADEKAPRAVGSAYNLITTYIPKILGAIYKLGEFLSFKKIKSPVYKANEKYKEELYNFIIDNGYDMVITTHLFPAQALSSLKEEKRINTHCVGIVADYAPAPLWEETHLDAYIIAHKDIASDFISKGIPEEKLFPLGIPVKSDFLEKTDKLTAREILEIEQDKPMYLIMTGSMGYGNIGSLIVSILNNYKNKVNIVVMGGINKRMKSSLRSRFARQKNVYIKGYSKRIPLYMDACDVLFTKPGAQTSTEAAIKNIPIILTEEIPGVEAKNAEFFKEKGLAFYDTDISNQLSAAAKLIRNEQARNEMLEAQQREINKNAAEDICDFILNFNR
ncbi:MAG: glycosyl transferase [Clostridia bacterium]|nr:glycosyl transferase [Clostridia bacterium]